MGFYLVKRREKEAAIFKEIEESKWGQKKKKVWKKEDDSNSEVMQRDSEFFQRGVIENKTQMKAHIEEKTKTVTQMLETLKTTNYQDIWGTVLSERLDVFEDEEETHTRTGVVGLSTFYFLEDFDAVKYKGDWRPPGYTEEEFELESRQTRQKLRGKLAEYGLIPQAHNKLWKTGTMEEWDEFAVSRRFADPDEDLEEEWEDATLQKTVDIVSGLLLDVSEESVTRCVFP